MANIVIVGAQWGDEAKGKIIDYLASQSSMVVRYGGGNNAGHSVTVGTEEYKFHLVPAGILNPGIICVIADGVVIDPGVLVRELDGLTGARHLPEQPENLRIGARHSALPSPAGRTAGGGAGREKIGTTGRGIGPAYMDKAARIGIRMGEFVNPARFASALARRSGGKKRPSDQSVWA